LITVDVGIWGIIGIGGGCWCSGRGDAIAIGAAIGLTVACVFALVGEVSAEDRSGELAIIRAVLLSATFVAEDTAAGDMSKNFLAFGISALSGVVGRDTGVIEPEGVDGDACAAAAADAAAAERGRVGS
jgi:hypothetical protein